MHSRWTLFLTVGAAFGRGGHAFMGITFDSAARRGEDRPKPRTLKRDSSSQGGIESSGAGDSWHTSAGQISAVHEDRLAGDVAAGLAAEHQHRADQFVRLGPAPEGGAVRERLFFRVR